MGNYHILAQTGGGGPKKDKNQNKPIVALTSKFKFMFIKQIKCNYHNCFWEPQYPAPTPERVKVGVCQYLIGSFICKTY